MPKKSRAKRYFNFWNIRKKNGEKKRRRRICAKYAAALKAYARAHKLSGETKADIAEIEAIAFREMGKMSRGLEKAKVARQDTEYQVTVIGKKKTETLAAAGIDVRRANEAEKLAEMTDAMFAKTVAELKQKDALRQPCRCQHSRRNAPQP